MIKAVSVCFAPGAGVLMSAMLAAMMEAGSVSGWTVEFKPRTLKVESRILWRSDWTLVLRRVSRPRLFLRGTGGVRTSC